MYEGIKHTGEFNYQAKDKGHLNYTLFVEPLVR